MASILQLPPIVPPNELSLVQPNELSLLKVFNPLGKNSLLQGNIRGPTNPIFNLPI